MDVVDFLRFAAIGRDALGELQATKTAGGFAIERVKLSNDIQSDKEVVRDSPTRCSIELAASSGSRARAAIHLPNLTSCYKRRALLTRHLFQLNHWSACRVLAGLRSRLFSQ